MEYFLWFLIWIIWVKKMCPRYHVYANEPLLNNLRYVHYISANIALKWMNKVYRPMFWGSRISVKLFLKWPNHITLQVWYLDQGSPKGRSWSTSTLDHKGCASRSHDMALIYILFKCKINKWIKKSSVFDLMWLDWLSSKRVSAQTHSTMLYFVFNCCTNINGITKL